MVATVGSIAIDLTTNIAKFSSGFRSAATTVERESGRMAGAARRADAGLTSLARTAAGALGGGFAIRQITRYADAWTEAGNKIRAASEISGTQARSLEDLNAIATKTRSGLGETVNLYSRLLRSTKDVAKSELEVARATEIVNKAFKAGGAATSEQVAGVLQLSQALGSGFLQGDELRSIRENAPLLAQAIADEFGTTIGGLKQLGADGELTVDRVFKAILKAQGKIDAAFAETQSTIGDAITLLGNAVTEAIGNLDKATGATAAFAKEINDLASDITEFGNSPGLDSFLGLFNLKIEEGGAADQARALFNELSRASQRSSQQVRADIERVQEALADLRLQAEQGFDVELQTDRAQQNLRELQDELRNLERAAAAASQNASGSLQGLVDSALKAIKEASEGPTLPEVTRYGSGSKGEAKSSLQRREVNGVGVIRPALEDTKDATERTARATENLENDLPRAIDGLGDTFDNSFRSVNQLLERGFQVHYDSIAAAVRTGIVSGMQKDSSERKRYSISTGSFLTSGISQLETEIQRLGLLANTVGSIAASSIQQRIAELELQKFNATQYRSFASGPSYGLAGYAEGGSFIVGGQGAGDKNLVQFMANAGERVTVSPGGGEASQRPIVLNYNAAPGESERTSRQNARDMAQFLSREMVRS